MTSRRPSPPRVRAAVSAAPDAAAPDVVAPTAAGVPAAAGVAVAERQEQPARRPPRTLPERPAPRTETLDAPVRTEPLEPPVRTGGRRRPSSGRRPSRRAGGASPSRPERRARVPREASPAPRQTRTVTVRTVVLAAVVLVAFIVLTPTLRAFVTQSEQRRAVEAEYAAVQSEVEALERGLERWNDPAFVESQARERLSFVRPGEVAYRVVDPQTVPSGTGEEFEGLRAAVPSGPQVPWYLSVWDSVVDVGIPPEERAVPGLETAQP